MRTSKRAHILDAALTVVEQQGIAAVTFEAVSAASGISRGGLIYHFPSKEAMMLALHEHLAQRWETELLETLGARPEQVSEDARVAAYAQVSIRSVTGPELQLMLESTSNPAYEAPWREVLNRWLPDPTAIDPEDPRQLARIVARLAADGLWLADSLGQHRLPDTLRAAIAQHIATSVRPRDESEYPNS